MATRRVTELAFRSPGLGELDRRVERFGETGERAFRRIRRGSGQASAGLKAINQVSREGQSALNDMAGSAGTAGRVLARLGPAGLVAAAGIGVSTLALTSMLRETSRFEREMFTVEAVLRATGNASGFTADQINRLSQEIGLATLATTGQVREASAILLTFRSLAGDTFERTLRLSQDVAALGLGSVTSAAQQLGKALEDPRQGLTSLRRIGISFTESQRDLINTLNETGRAAEAQAIILDVLEGQLGGAGIGAAAGLAGATDSMSENWTRLLENFGRSGPAEAAAASLRPIANVLANINTLLEETPIDRLQRLEGEESILSGGGTTEDLLKLNLRQAFGFTSIFGRGDELGEARIEAGILSDLEGMAAAQALAASEAAQHELELEGLNVAVNRLAERADPAAKRAEELADAQAVLAGAVDKGAITAERAAEIQSGLQAQLDGTARATARLAGVRDNAIAGLRFEVERTAAMAAAHQQGAEAIAATEAETQALTLARRLGLEEGDAELEQIRELTGERARLTEEVAAVTAAEEARHEAMERSARVAEKNFREIVDFGRDQFTGWFDDMAGEWQGLWGDLAGIALRTLAQIAAEAAATLIAPQLGITGIGAPAGTAAGAVAGISPLGLVGTGGRQLLGGSTLGGLFGQQLGPGVFGPAAPGTLTSATLSQVLGAAGIGALGGSLLAQLTGGNQVGGGVGGGLGAAAGFAIGGPIGGLVGGLGGSVLGGLFGGGRPSSEEATFLASPTTGGIAVTSSEGGRNAQAARDLAEQFLTQLVPAIAAAAGGAVPRGIGGFGFGVSNRDVSAFGGGGGVRRFAAGDTEGALLEASRRLALQLDGVSDELRGVIGRSRATTAGGLVSDIEFARFVLGEDEPAQLQTALDQIGVAMDQMTDRALDLGLAMDDVTRATERAAQAMVDDLLGGIEAFQQSLAIGDLAPISPAERFARAESAFDALTGRARAGELDAIAAFPAAAQQFLGIARDTFASGSEFARVFSDVNRTLQTILDIPGFVHGTDSAPPGLAMVGERGPELVRFRGGESVIPLSSSGAAAVTAGAIDRQGAQTSAELQILIDLTEQTNRLLQAMRSEQARMNADLTRLRAA